MTKSSKALQKMGPKVLIFDIETAPLIINAWSLWDNFTPLNMMKEDWFILSWAAKWLGDGPRKVMYEDMKDEIMVDNNSRDDLALLIGIRDLLDEADIVITQNGKKFDAKKINARLVLNGLRKPSPYKHIDTLQIAKAEFAFTSNKLEFMTDKLCVKYKKLKHGNFAGFDLWKECLLGNPKAWAEMKKYNKYDVLSLEELYMIIRPWFSKHPNFALYFNDDLRRCNVCGSAHLTADGHAYTNLSKFEKFKCDNCGASVRDRTSVTTKAKRASLFMNVGK